MSDVVAYACEFLDGIKTGLDQQESRIATTAAMGTVAVERAASALHLSNAIPVAAPMTHSEKTKLGITKARTDGVVWGKSGHERAAENKKCADEYAATLSEVVLDVLKASKRPWRYSRVAKELTARGVTARRGGVLHSKTVARLLKRMPTIVEVANEFRRMKENEEFKDFFGTEPPSKQEILEKITSCE